jgi:chromosome partitioning protein
MADYRTNLTKEVINEVKQHFAGKVYNTVIPRSVKLTEAPGFGKPIALYDEHSLGAKKYSAVAEEIMGLPINPEVIESKELTQKMEESHGEEIG